MFFYPLHKLYLTLSKESVSIQLQCHLFKVECNSEPFLKVKLRLLIKGLMFYFNNNTVWYFVEYFLIKCSHQFLGHLLKRKRSANVGFVVTLLMVCQPVHYRCPPVCPDTLSWLCGNRLIITTLYFRYVCENIFENDEFFGFGGQ